MRTLLRVITALLLVPIALATLGFALYAPVLPVRVARSMSARQLAMVLDEGERLERTTPALRRPLWRYFHPIAGLLAATDRRLIWVGVEPRAIIEWSGEEPSRFEIRDWSYDSVVVADTRVHLGVSRGLAVRASPDAGALRFAVRPVDATTREAVIATIERRQAEVRETAERERIEQERAAFLARQPVYHTVQRGEAVSSIAVLYGLTPDSLRALNSLTSDRIIVGQELLVKPGAP
ncbi:MAG TPA: LysM peptidoglycan-binding domain-containing protein [Gemmatimonadaceae bacterium]|nr:LysM peptidoglycan-binding domain-containing protein [Gemmatimonadaceae bacterium]